MLGVGPFGPLGPGSAWRPARDAGSVAEPQRPARSGLPDLARGIASHDLAEERQAWVVLACVDGVGERTLAALVATHGSARRALWLAARGRLARALRRDVDGSPRTLPTAVLGVIEAAARDPGAGLAAVARAGAWTVTLLDPDYPRRFLALVAPPPVVFGQGRASALDARRAVAIVGTRRASPRGRFEASRIAASLATRGVSVVSGLAVGIDGAAHAAALEAGGVTVAAIGSGHLRPGPTAHRALARRIAERGAVVGELAPDSRATPGTYPRRNRLIAALADAVVVVEAPERSGALITARLGLEQGIPVFAFAPGAPALPSWEGCRRLVADGYARTFRDAGALCEALGWESAAGPTCVARGWESAATPMGGAASREDHAASTGWPWLGASERECARLLARGPRTMDALLASTGAAPGELAAVLTLLQLRGLVRTLGPLYLPAGALLSGTEPTGGPRPQDG